MEERPLSVLFSGTGGDRVRRAGETLMKAFGRCGLRAWGRSRRRDEDGVSRFLIAAAPEPGTMLPAPVVSADIDSSTLSSGGRTHPLPYERLTGKIEDTPTLLAGAAAGMFALDAAACWAADETGAAGHAYAAANFPATGAVSAASARTPSPSAASGAATGAAPAAQFHGGELYVLNGGSAAAAGAVAAGCRCVVATRPSPALERLARSDLGLSLDRVDDGDTAVLRAAGAGFAGARALALIDEPGLRRAEATLRWAARAEIPLVVCVIDAGETALVHALSHDDKTAPYAVLAPTSVEELYHGMSEAFATAERCQCPVTVLVDRLLNERWETRQRPIEAKSADRGAWGVANSGSFDRYAVTESGVSARAVPGQERLLFTLSARVRTKKLERKYNTLRAELLRVPVAPPGTGETLILTWGGAYPAVRWAAETLHGTGGPRIHAVPVRVPAPLQDLAQYAAWRKAARIVVVESTAGRPLSRWLRTAAGIEAAATAQVDRPYDAQRTLRALQEALDV
ncbi:MAG: hypothetical protein ABIJ96_18120 [Elusimicrobiota bacterium]